MLKKPPLIIDTCTMSNLFSGQAFCLLRELYKNDIVISGEIYLEAVKYAPLKSELCKALEKEKWMKLGVIDEIADLKLFAQFQKRADPGEASIMVLALKMGGTVGSDDMTGVVRICKRYNIPILGTMGILYDAYTKQIISCKSGDKIIRNMKNNGRNIPVNEFYDILNWFENGKGRELY